MDGGSADHAGAVICRPAGDHPLSYWRQRQSSAGKSYPEVGLDTFPKSLLSATLITKARRVCRYPTTALMLITE